MILPSIGTSRIGIAAARSRIAGIGWPPTRNMASMVPALSSAAAGPGRRYFTVRSLSLRPTAASSTAASAAGAADRPLGRAGDRPGDQPADLEEAAAGRGGADAEEARLLRQSNRAKQGRKKQTGADEAAPALPQVHRLTR